MATIKKVKIVKRKAVDDKSKIYKNCTTGKVFSKVEDLITDIDSSAYGFYDEYNVDIQIEGKALNFGENGMPFCCGMDELGDLTVEEGIDIVKAAKFIDELVSRIPGRTTIVNTIQVGGPKRFADVLEKTKSFVLVKTFKNKNGGNTIKTWISNNE